MHFITEWTTIKEVLPLTDKMAFFKRDHPVPTNQGYIHGKEYLNAVSEFRYMGLLRPCAASLG